MLDPDEGETDLAPARPRPDWQRPARRPARARSSSHGPRAAEGRGRARRWRSPCPEQPHRSPPRRQDDIRRPGVDSTRGAPPGRHRRRRPHAERRGAVLHADSSATWAPRSSRSSGPDAATMPARGRRRTGARRAPRSWRSIATRKASPSTSSARAGSRFCTVWSAAPTCFVQSLRPGAIDELGLDFAGGHRAQPATRLLLDHRVRHARPARAPARLRSADAGVRRPDVGQRPSRIRSRRASARRSSTWAPACGPRSASSPRCASATRPGARSR